MANIIRKNQKVFAKNAVNNGQFGSLQDTTKVLTQDLDILQANPAYELGWNNATISGEKLPSLEEFQSLNYINTSQITYLLNKGIPEWVVDAEYYIGDIQREVAGTKIYRSITNNNIGNILTNITHWVLLVDLATVSVAPASQVEVNAGVVANKFVAPSTLAGLFNNSSRLSNGYIRIPVKVGGAFVEIIVQWGTTPNFNNENGQIIVLPITFPNAILNAQGTVKINTVGSNNDYWAQTYAQTTSSIGIFLQLSGGTTSFPVSINWIAVGY